MENKSEQFQKNILKIKFLLEDKNVFIVENEDRDSFYDKESGKYLFSMINYSDKDSIDRMLEVTNDTIGELSKIFNKEEIRDIVTLSFKGNEIIFEEVFYVDYHVSENGNIDYDRKEKFYTKNQVERNIEEIKKVYFNDRTK